MTEMEHFEGWSGSDEAHHSQKTQDQIDGRPGWVDLPKESVERQSDWDAKDHVDDHQELKMNQSKDRVLLKKDEPVNGSTVQWRWGNAKDD